MSNENDNFISSSSDLMIVISFLILILGIWKFCEIMYYICVIICNNLI